MRTSAGPAVAIGTLVSAGVLVCAGSASADVPTSRVHGPDRVSTAVEVQGEAVLRVDVTGVTHPTLVPEPGYGGPDQLQLRANDVVRQVVVGTGHEGRRGVFLGLAGTAPFRVFSLTGPTRLVIDIQRPG